MKISPSFNHMPDAHDIRIGGVILYFSYNTVIAFEDVRKGVAKGLVVRENAWGSKTGKHLNRVDGGGKEARARRLPSEEFETELNTLVEGMMK